jgi:[ribosomal protein S5]-alanine N-acetyltransferase
MTNSYITGKNLYLRHPTRDDALGCWHEWMSDEETTRWLNLRYWPNTIEKQIRFFESLEVDTSKMVLSIVDIDSDRHIGVCSLSHINWVHRYCDVSIIIGDKNFKSGRYTLEAITLLLRVAFYRLNMRNIKSAYSLSNESSHVMHKLLKFREVGRVPALYWDHGNYVDEVIAVLSFSDWQLYAS